MGGGGICGMDVDFGSYFLSVFSSLSVSVDGSDSAMMGAPDVAG